MLCPLRLAVREGIGLIQVRKDTDGVLLGTEISKDPVEMFLDIEGTYLNLITIESHQIRLDSESTGLVKTTTTAGGAEFAKIGDVHLTQSIEVEII